MNATAAVYELKLWAMWFLKAIPGQIGCLIRRRFLPGRYGPGTTIWDGVQIDHPSRLSVGSNTSVNRGSVLNCAGGVAIGDNVLIGPGVIIYSQNHQYRDPSRLIRDQGYSLKPVTICDDVWIAARAVILPGVTIGRGAVVASGAVVTRSVSPYDVVAGIPARTIATRSTKGFSQ